MSAKIFKPKWASSTKTIIFLFNVERGLSIFIRLPNNHGIIYDIGACENFSPTDFIEKKLIDHIQIIDQLIVSHPHKDHYQEAEKMLKMLGGKNKSPRLVTMPHFVVGHQEELDASRLQSMSTSDMTLYKSIYGTRKPPLQAIHYDNKIQTADIECGLFYMRPPSVATEHPTNDQEYGNGVSLCFYLKHNNHAIWISGDITSKIIPSVLSGAPSVERRFSILGQKPASSWLKKSSYSETSNNPSINELLSQDDISLINITPHHGLESCYAEDLFNIVTPIINIASEKNENAGKCADAYSKKSSGMYVDQGNVNHLSDEKRNFLTTRKDGHIVMILGHDSSPKIYHSSNYEDLMTYLIIKS